jgi:16S rRNA (uracil1498-N3)-methyltransferase
MAAAHVLVGNLAEPILDPEDEHHLRNVLRVRQGEEVTVTDGCGAWRLCVFGRQGSLDVLEPAGEVVRSCRPQPLLTIGFVPVKGDRPEWAVQKLTELGVDRIVLLSSERSVVRWEEAKARSHLERLRRVARQALMQSRGLWLPEVCGVEPVDSLVAATGVALASAGGALASAGGALASAGGAPGSAGGAPGSAGGARASAGGALAGPSLEYPTVLVGPEGGWTEAEVAQASTVVSLGPGVLRTETAAVAAGVLLTALRSGLVARSG